MATKRVMTTVTQADLTAVQGGVGGGDHALMVECPVDYDPAKITAEDIVSDGQIRTVSDDARATLEDVAAILLPDEAPRARLGLLDPGEREDILTAINLNPSVSAQTIADDILEGRAETD